MFLLYRFLSRLSYAGSWHVKHKKSPMLTWNREGFFVLAAAASHVFYNVSYYASGNYLALGAVGSLYQFSSMLFGAVLSLVFGLEKFRTLKLVAIILCSLGTLLILQPYPLFDLEGKPEQGETTLKYIQNKTFVLSQEKIIMINNTVLVEDEYVLANITKTEPENIINSKNDNAGSDFLLGIGLAVIAGIFASVQFVIQKLELRDVSGNLIIVWVSIIGMSISIIISLFTETLTMVTSWDKILIFLFHCSANVFTVAVFYAPSYTNVTVITTTLSMVTVFMYIAQRTVLSHIFPGAGNWLEILGILVTTAGSMLIPLYEGLKGYCTPSDEKGKA